MVVSRMLVWVHLQNLPLHLWDQPNLLGINNTISWYIKMDTQRLEERIFTLSRICVEVNLSNFHHQRMAIFTIKLRWGGSWCETSHTNEDNHTNKESETQELHPQSSMDSQPVNIPDAMDTSGSKWLPTSNNSYSDKENPLPEDDTSLTFVSLMQTQGEWCKVEKKKGRKTWFFSQYVHYFLQILMNHWLAHEWATTSTTCNFFLINKIRIFLVEKKLIFGTLNKIYSHLRK